jgi:hypothetical protein
LEDDWDVLIVEQYSNSTYYHIIGKETKRAGERRNTIAIVIWEAWGKKNFKKEPDIY